MYYFSDVKLYSYHTSDKYYSYYVSNNYCIWLVIQAITEFKYNKKNPASRQFSWEKLLNQFGEDNNDEQ